MFYVTEVEDYVRVIPEYFNMPVREAVTKQLHNLYKGHISKDLGLVIAILDVTGVGEGVIIPGDGAAYYKSNFKILNFKPELQELVLCKVSEITNFGAFMDLGCIEGMIHISQTMDDYVSFSKSNTLIGKNSKRSLKKGDLCLARVVAISYKSDQPKIGLTMRQPGLGRMEWISEDKKKSKLKVLKSSKGEFKGKRK